MRQILHRNLPIPGFLKNSWTGLPEWIIKNENEEYEINDWLQANWEILVEAKLNEPFCKREINSARVILEFYGNGADIDGRGSSRVIYPDELPTHYILVNDKYRFDSFGTKYDTGWFEPVFPFDYIKVVDKDNNEIILSVDAVTFSLKNIEK